MINMGTKAVVFERDGWTVTTRDRKQAAPFEYAADFSIIEQAINK